MVILRRNNWTRQFHCLPSCILLAGSFLIQYTTPYVIYNLAGLKCTKGVTLQSPRPCGLVEYMLRWTPEGGLRSCSVVSNYGNNLRDWLIFSRKPLECNLWKSYIFAKQVRGFNNERHSFKQIIENIDILPINVKRTAVL